jgi:hypothetical protein
MRMPVKQWRMTYTEKQYAALRMWYRGGYTGYFAKQVRRMLDNGCALEDMLAACIDETMKEWIIKHTAP